VIIILQEEKQAEARGVKSDERFDRPGNGSSPDELPRLALSFFGAID